MRILSVDPGYDRLGIAVLEKQDGREILLHSSCVLTDKQNPLADRLATLGEVVRQTIAEYKPDGVALETLFFNKNITTAIGVAQARGIVIYLAKCADCAIFEYGPQEVKVAVTGYGKSDKAAVIDMVMRLIPDAPSDALDDEYDAIAVGITALAHQR